MASYKFKHHSTVGGFKDPLNTSIRIHVYYDRKSDSYAMNVQDFVKLFNFKTMSARNVRVPCIIPSGQRNLRFVRFTDVPGLLWHYKYGLTNIKPAIDQIMDAKGRPIAKPDSGPSSDLSSPPHKRIVASLVAYNFTHHSTIGGFDAPLNTSAHISVYHDSKSDTYALSTQDFTTLFGFEDNLLRYVHSPLIISTEVRDKRFVRFVDIAQLLADYKYDARNIKPALSQFMNANGQLKPKSFESESESDAPPRKRHIQPEQCTDVNVLAECQAEEEESSAPPHRKRPRDSDDDVATLRELAADIRESVRIAVANIGPAAVNDYVKTKAFKDSIEQKRSEIIAQLKEELRDEVRTAIRRDQERATLFDELKDQICQEIRKEINK